MYHDRNNLMVGCFAYKNKIYHSGTKVLFNGECILNGNKVYLNNVIVVYQYNYNDYEYFKYNYEIYICKWLDFKKYIVQIIKEEPPAKQDVDTEFYWTDDMVAKTIWYVIIMLVAVIFKDCIGIWIFATIIWCNSVLKKKK